MTHLNRNTHRPYPYLHWPVTARFVIWLILICLVVVLVPPAVLAWQSNLADSSGSPASSVVAQIRLQSANPLVREQAVQQLAVAARSGSSDALYQLASFFERDDILLENGLVTARALASVGTRPAYQVLIQGFRQDQPSARRMVALAALEQTKPAVVPQLIAALQDTDPGVRATSAELLGFRHDVIAADALAKATYDPDAGVRAAAAWAVGGELSVWQSLPRMQLLQATDPDMKVRESAILAGERIQLNVAQALGLESSDLVAVTIALPGGKVYAASHNELFALRDSSYWQHVGPLPDTALALAAGGPDGQVVYLGSMSQGPLRSLDGGQTWQPMKSGLPAAERLTATALVVDPNPAQSGRRVYMALAATFGTTELHTTPLGIYRSDDGGATWLPMGNPVTDYVTTQLAIDPAAPGVLHGVTEGGTWQIPLSP